MFLEFPDILKVVWCQRTWKVELFANILSSQKLAQLFRMIPIVLGNYEAKCPSYQAQRRSP